jgi:hypothetical protein
VFSTLGAPSSVGLQLACKRHAALVSAVWLSRFCCPYHFRKEDRGWLCDLHAAAGLGKDRRKIALGSVYKHD